MPFKYNAISGKLDYYDYLSRGEVIGSILTDMDETIEPIPEVEILFNDSGNVLYVDDNEDMEA